MIENHLVDIIRFSLYIISSIISVIVMIKADENRLLRVIAAGVGATAIRYNEELAHWAYLLIGSAIETAIAMMGVGFVLTLGISIMLMPIATLIGKLLHREEKP